ncbi:hypothetical protein MA16_Dca023389 [Dendrobium catenatum]|uniref:Uncharacterized protein n=1 Tax=Dendrobium catenatum TaxID=906689 RepID=A0A2I0XAG9_9ASPA|nr:hypothetical protein MA16_Dca023389 [Dendrobium catenatum]
MEISAEKVPPSPREPLVPPVSSETRLQRRVSFRSNLHDLDSPFLTTWGKQQVLRCLNVTRKGEIIIDHHRSVIIGPSANRLREAAAPNCKIYEPEPDDQPEVLRAPFPCAPAAPMLVPTPSSNSPSDVGRTCNMRSRRVPIRKKRCSSPSPPPPVVEKSMQRSV